jgi:AraC-like DNA-binding protein
MHLICEERESDSPVVELVWRSRINADTTFTSIAESHAGIVVSRYNGIISLTVRGPESYATAAHAPAGMETFGIMFKSGVFFADWMPQTIRDRNDITLPSASDNRFWLKGAAWQFPDFDNADVFVNRLLHDGLLVQEPIVDQVLNSHIVRGVSLRTVQRRFLQAAGLTHGALLQIDRARFAARLLTQGVSILDTVDQAGYYDQPHLTRSLKSYIGFTPAQLISAERTQPLSFLYKNVPLHLDDNVNIINQGAQQWNRQQTERTAHAAVLSR